VYVNPLPQPNAGPDAIICFGVPYRLNGSGGNIYQWSPSTYLSNAGVANPVAVLPAPGFYQYLLNVSSNGCKSVLSDTIRIKVLPPALVFAGNDTLIAAGQPLQLNAVDVNGTGFGNYAWTPSFGLNNALIKDPVATLTQSTTYIVNASSPEGCRATDNIKVTVFLAPEIYVPNAFTPNDDGSNDIFKPILVGIRELKYFSVYNRYGQLVYTTAVQGKGWDGRVGSVMQNTGAFAWIAEAIDYRGNTIKRKGSVILIK
jgi:gliding motility-associated-like protein